MAMNNNSSSHGKHKLGQQTCGMSNLEVRHAYKRYVKGPMSWKMMFTLRLCYKGVVCALKTLKASKHAVLKEIHLIPIKKLP